MRILETQLSEISRQIEEEQNEEYMVERSEFPVKDNEEELLENRSVSCDSIDSKSSMEDDLEDSLSTSDEEERIQMEQYHSLTTNEVHNEEGVEDITPKEHEEELEIVGDQVLCSIIDEVGEVDMDPPLPTSIKENEDYEVEVCAFHFDIESPLYTPLEKEDINEVEVCSFNFDYDNLSLHTPLAKDDIYDVEVCPFLFDLDDFSFQNSIVVRDLGELESFTFDFETNLVLSSQEPIEEELNVEIECGEAYTRNILQPQNYNSTMNEVGDEQLIKRPQDLSYVIFPWDPGGSLNFHLMEPQLEQVNQIVKVTLDKFLASNFKPP